MEFGDGVETVSSSGTRSGRPYLAAPDYRHQVSDALLFPSLLTSLQPDYFLTYRLFPQSPSRTHVIAETFVHPQACAPGVRQAHHDDLVPFWQRVNQEDRAICESQQIGLTTPGYRPAAYYTDEDGVHAFDARVARAYRGEP